ncbi:hypothetical protein [Streptomyces sp. S.PB5]|uniref:hypothetical protein n=1 Tax=Streptomyces sp. S.PB5 TaxID=3020844 RepID=UPI0025AF38D1|nr:hypothetical protein [Streptomyces sp. S.PB5]MDN3021709.1 hypothetical protein [Streptomyces sp. S.PB5]
MKHRGRHRRRRQGKALRAFLAGTALALTAAATMISASQATVASDPGALRPLASAAETDALELREHLQPQRDLDRLADAMGEPAGVSDVLASADRTLRSAADCSAAERRALPAEPAATRAYCWDAADTRSWRAGAVTTSGDADDDGLWGANRVILSAWSQGSHDLARVAFIDAGDMDRLTYSWVLLTVPVDGGRDYRALDSQVSGMVWYQDKLLVTAAEGLYVYDMDRVQRTTVDSPAVGRVAGGGWAGHGYRWVLPAVGSYTLAGGEAAAHPDYISLDRSTSPDSLVASEWVSADADRAVRLWRYDLGTTSDRAGLLATDPAGYARVNEAYETKTAGVGPVLSYRSDWYLGRSPDTDGDHGTLWRQNATGAAATQCGTDESHQCWSTASESLSYWESTGELWSQSGRVLFALPLASVNRALG